MKTIFRTKHATHFTTLPNGLLRDKQLSFRARGVLAMVLSNSEEWEVTQVWLREQGAEGKEAIAASIRELEAAGYAVFDQERRGGGAFSQGVWTFYDAPVALSQRTTKTALKEPPTGLPPTGNPVGGKPHDGNPATKKDYQKEGLSEEENQKNSAPSAAVASEVCLPTFGDIEQIQSEPQQEKKVPSFGTQFIEAWSAAYLADRGEKYFVAGAKDAVAAKRIAASGLSVADLISMARRAWVSSGPKFYRCEKAITISYFVSSFNEIRSELSAKPTSRTHKTSSPTHDLVAREFIP